MWLSQADLWHDRPHLSLFLWQRRDLVAPTPIKIDMEAIVRSSALLIPTYRPFFATVVWQNVTIFLNIIFHY